MVYTVKVTHHEHIEYLQLSGVEPFIDFTDSWHVALSWQTPVDWDELSWTNTFQATTEQVKPWTESKSDATDEMTASSISLSFQRIPCEVFCVNEYFAVWPLEDDSGLFMELFPHCSCVTLGKINVVCLNVIWEWNLDLVWLFAHYGNSVGLNENKCCCYSLVVLTPKSVLTLFSWLALQACWAGVTVLYSSLIDTNTTRHSGPNFNHFLLLYLLTCNMFPALCCTN